MTEPMAEAPTLIEELGLTDRPFNCLTRAGIKTVEDLLAKTEDDILLIPNIGMKSLREIEEALGTHGLHLSGEYRTDEELLSGSAIHYNLRELLPVVDEQLTVKSVTRVGQKIDIGLKGEEGRSYHMWMDFPLQLIDGDGI